MFSNRICVTLCFPCFVIFYILAYVEVSGLKSKMYNSSFVGTLSIIDKWFTHPESIKSALSHKNEILFKWECTELAK